MDVQSTLANLAVVIAENKQSEATTYAELVALRQEHEALKQKYETLLEDSNADPEGDDDGGEETPPT